MIEIAVPWSMSYMIQQNGYHPLYSYLLSNPLSGIKLNSLDDVETRENIKKNPNEVQRLTQKGKDCLKNLPEYFSNFFLKSDTYLLELGIASEIDGDIEFIHTSPTITGTKPFILHLESFFSLFLPFCADPNIILDENFPLRAQMKKMLQSDNCIGIFSHLKQTIKEIEVYFKDELISNKLHYMPIGYEPPKQIISKKTEKKSKKRILVLSSAHQNPNNFIDRGAGVVLEVWSALLKLNCDFELIWRSSEPNKHIIEELLSTINISSSELEKLIKSITWVDRHLTERELDHLFDSSDFVLLPSLWLHSTTILRAISSGCKPIVSDIPQIDEYRCLKDIKIIKGFRDLNWCSIKGIWAPKGRLKHSRILINDIVESLIKECIENQAEKKKRLIDVRNELDPIKKSNIFYKKIQSIFKRTKEAIKNKNPHFRYLDQVSINHLCTLSPAPIYLGATEPHCASSNDKEISKAFEINPSYTKPKFVFEIANRVHVISNNCWTTYASSLWSLSAYHGLNDNNISVIKRGGLINYISSNDTQLVKVKSYTLRLNNFYRLRNRLIDNPKTDGIDFDIELIDDLGTDNLLRVYHLYLGYPKNLGPFPVVEFILNPLKFTKHLNLTEWYFRHSLIY